MGSSETISSPYIGSSVHPLLKGCLTNEDCIDYDIIEDPVWLAYGNVLTQSSSNALSILETMT
jgi:hypothetical protein